jgi:hypothetical protein
MYDELLRSPAQRLLAHSLLLLMCCGFGLGLLAEQAGEQRWSRRYAEAELEQPITPTALDAHLTLDRDTLCLLHVHSPTVSQSWLRVRVQIINVDTGAVAADQSIHLSSYFSLQGGRHTSRGEDTREVFMRLPAGRWHLRVTGEAPPEPAPLTLGGGLRMGEDGQLVFEPPVVIPSLPIFDITGTRTLANDEAAQVTFTTDVVMSRYGVMLGFAALCLLGVFMMARSAQVNRLREQQALHVQRATQQAISRLLAHNIAPHLAQALGPLVNPAPQAPAEPQPLTLTRALAASLLIVSALIGVAAASVYGVV